MRPLRIRYIEPSLRLEDLPKGKPRGNGPQLSKAARRAKLAAEIRAHKKTAHAGEKVAPAYLGWIIYGEDDAPTSCDVCGQAYMTRERQKDG